MDPKVRELIKNWLIHTRKNKLTDPDENDLRNFLNDQGYDAEVIEQAFSAISSTSSRHSSNDDEEDSEQEQNYIDPSPQDDETVDADNDVNIDSDKTNQEDNEEEQLTFDMMNQSQRDLYKEVTNLISDLKTSQKKALAKELTRNG